MLPLLFAQALPDATAEVDMFGQVWESRGVVLLVLLVLVGMSVATWFIIGFKWWFLKKVQVQTDAFLKTYWDDKRWEVLQERAQANGESPVSRMFQACYNELVRIRKKARAADGQISFSHEDVIANIQRMLTRTQGTESSRVERMVSFLGTVGASAPFIGLFGTVWGIMKAFAYINPNRPILETVTPHIAQALIATAIGLFAAIPAVIAYNYFVGRIKLVATEMDTFAQDFLNDISRMDIGERSS
jgi:biopolymer transport protein TolQ